MLNVPPVPAPRFPAMYDYNWPTGYENFTIEEKALYNQQPGLAIYINIKWLLAEPDSPSKTYLLQLILSQNGLPHIVP